MERILNNFGLHVSRFCFTAHGDNPTLTSALKCCMDRHPNLKSLEVSGSSTLVPRGFLRVYQLPGDPTLCTLPLLKLLRLDDFRDHPFNIHLHLARHHSKQFTFLQLKIGDDQQALQIPTRLPRRELYVECQDLQIAQILFTNFNQSGLPTCYTWNKNSWRF